MKTWTQNLRECDCGKAIGSKLFHGRGSCHGKREWKAEWYLFQFAKSFACTLEFQDGGDGVMLHLAFPFLFSIYIGVTGVCRVDKSFEIGFKIHSHAFWLYPLCWTMESNSGDPWYRKCHCWYFPWTYDHWLTEILDSANGMAVVWKEGKGSGRKERFTDRYDEREAMKKRVSSEHPYTYYLKNGKVQNRTATIYVSRMTWRMKWWPLLPFKKARTCIDVAFNEEVGEGTGSWKGGCTGCGYDMMLGETPLATLLRMQSERKFGR